MKGEPKVLLPGLVVPLMLLIALAVMRFVILLDPIP